MGYTRNFGMRSFENIVRDGRFRAPRTGEPFQIGAPVTLDRDNPGYLKAADASSAPGPASGVVIYEHIQNKSDALTTVFDGPHRLVPLGQYAQMVHGAGAKVWFRNTGDKVMYDGRTQDGGSLLADSVDVAALRPGDGLVPDGSGKYQAAGAGADAWLVVEQVNPTAGRVEARFTF